MSDETRALRWAKQVWSESPVSETEVRLGADRVARHFAAPRRALVPRAAWRVAGVTAAVLGALAYAGRGAWFESHAPARAPAPAFVEPPNDPPKPIAPSGEEEPPAPVVAPPAVTGPVPTTGAGPAEKKRRSGPIAPSPASPPTTAVDASWIEVSDALAAHDHARAEQLLTELSNGRHDANTRAKAHLGLAQLDEAKNECESARKHALIAASIPDIEIKTVRRALELAARCAR
jgi:hypothetical protein